MLQLGVVLLEQGRAQQALAYLDKALEMDPDHQQALLNSAVLIQARLDLDWLMLDWGVEGVVGNVVW